MKAFKKFNVDWLHLLFIVFLWSLTFVLFVALMNYRGTPKEKNEDRKVVVIKKQYANPNKH